MTNTINSTELITPYTTDASPSWNGYNHQGKVGIYVALQMMKDIKKEDMPQYELELEWFEDFSIKKNGEYKSIHQVKTYADTATSKYKDAIWLLLAKLLDFKELESAHLHVTQKLTNIKDLETNLLTYVMGNAEKEEEKDSKNHKIKKYATPKECHDHVKASGEYHELFSKFSLYNYDTLQCWCSQEDIEEKIKRQLKVLINEEATTDVRVDRAYYHLLGLVDNNIRRRHLNIQEGSKEVKVPINFQAIYNVVYQNFELMSKEYAAYFLKNEFHRISLGLLEDLKFESAEGLISEEAILGVNNTLGYINELNESEFIEFCLKITPDNEVSQEIPEHILKTIKKCLNETGLIESFFEAIKQIGRELEYKKFTYSKRGQDGVNTTYLPSTIIESQHTSRTRRLVNRILDNAQPDMLSEVDKIITKSINLSTLGDYKVYSDVPEPEKDKSEESVDYYNRITKIKRISLIDIKAAKGDLSN